MSAFRLPWNFCLSWSAFASLVQVGAPDPCVAPGQTSLAESSTCSWASQYGSRDPVEAGAKARGIDASPQDGEADLESVWPGSVLERVRRDGVRLLLVTPYCPVLGPDFPSLRFSMGDSRQEGSPLSDRGHHPPPSPGVVGMAPEGAHLIASDLSTEVVETILQSRTPSTRKLTVLEFRQDRFSAGLAHSTLKVYVVAISAYHAPLGGFSVGRNPLVTRFLHGALRLRPPVRPQVPPWDLAVVLEALYSPSSGINVQRRVGDLQDFSVASSHLDFAPGMAKAFLHPRPGYVLKVPSSAPRPVVLQAFCPPPFREPDQQKLNCMCPVRVLDAYIHRAARWRRADQLFVCYGPPKRDLPAFKQTLSRWTVDAITLAYESSSLPSPLGVKAHST
ncbi:Piriformospora indica-insensitive protein 2 [Labeo rohita]|uniref:Piriformospora indica-insensitive protein 2 n=1 Tax=Labeo rohita TaxID=84645 RepID=A0ABQ8M423_LABRO|nr:Piriformospora indica-insensitive protein 2 [Labeo rohita]